MVDVAVIDVVIVDINVVAVSAVAAGIVAIDVDDVVGVAISVAVVEGSFVFRFSSSDPRSLVYVRYASGKGEGALFLKAVIQYRPWIFL